MFGIHDFAVFLIAGILLNLTPGPDTFYVLGRSMAQGRKAGVASALGINTGSIVHTFAAACGLSAIITASATAFLFIKLAGAIYLLYLGLHMIFFSKPKNTADNRFNSSNFFTIFRQGLITNVLNPKVALFYLAFLPQFISSDSPSKFCAFITLGLCFVFTGTIWCLCIAYFSSAISRRLRDNNSFATYLNRAAGTLFLYLGIKLATEK